MVDLLGNNRPSERCKIFLYTLRYKDDTSIDERIIDNVIGTRHDGLYIPPSDKIGLDFVDIVKEEDGYDYPATIFCNTPKINCVSSINVSEKMARKFGIFNASFDVKIILPRLSLSKYVKVVIYKNYLDITKFDFCKVWTWVKNSRKFKKDSEYFKPENIKSIMISYELDTDRILKTILKYLRNNQYENIIINKIFYIWIDLNKSVNESFLNMEDTPDSYFKELEEDKYNEDRYCSVVKVDCRT